MVLACDKPGAFAWWAPLVQPCSASSPQFDIDFDGLDDLLVGAAGADRFGGQTWLASGRIYAVAGQAVDELPSGMLVTAW